MSDIFNQLLAETDNEYAGIVDDGVAAGDVSGYIGTGNYAMNRSEEHTSELQSH